MQKIKGWRVLFSNNPRAALLCLGIAIFFVIISPYSVAVALPDVIRPIFHWIGEMPLWLQMICASPVMVLGILLLPGFLLDALLVHGFNRVGFLDNFYLIAAASSIFWVSSVAAFANLQERLKRRS